MTCNRKRELVLRHLLIGKRELNVHKKSPRVRDFSRERALQVCTSQFISFINFLEFCLLSSNIFLLCLTRCWYIIWVWCKEKHQVQDKAFGILERGKNGVWSCTIVGTYLWLIFSARQCYLPLISEKGGTYLLGEAMLFAAIVLITIVGILRDMFNIAMYVSPLTVMVSNFYPIN
jgi:magnesium-transporting ATPase (P-type)